MNAVSNNQENLLQRWAHDVRSPLLSLEVLASSLESIPSNQRNLLKVAVDRLKGMTQEILYTSKTPTHASLDETPSVAQSIDRVTSLKWLEIADRPGITLSVRFGQGVRDVRSRLSAVAFERLFSNLLNNASESLAGAGSIEVSLIADARSMYLLIEDTGCGMSRDVLRLVREGRALSFGKSNGFGIGLSSARREIESAGGQLDIESIEGRGTTLKIRLPLAVSRLAS